MVHDSLEKIWYRRPCKKPPLRRQYGDLSCESERRKKSRKRDKDNTHVLLGEISSAVPALCPRNDGDTEPARPSCVDVGCARWMAHQSILLGTHLPKRLIDTLPPFFGGLCGVRSMSTRDFRDRTIFFSFTGIACDTSVESLQHVDVIRVDS